MEITGIRKGLEAQKTGAMAQYSKYKSMIDGIVIPADLADYAQAIKSLRVLSKNASKVFLKFDYSLIATEKEKFKEARFKEYTDKSAALEEELNRRIEEVEADIAGRVEKNNQKVKDEFEKGNKVYLDLEERRKKLEEYSDFIVDQCANHGITSSDILIDNDSYRLDEWNSIYDTAFDYIKKHGAYVNPVTWLRKLVNNDAKAEAVIVIGILIISLTTILNYVAVFFLLAVLYSELTQKKQIQKCSVLLGLLYNVRPLEMGYTDQLDETKLLNKDDEIDSDERTEEILAWYDEENAKLDAENPEEEVNAEFEKLNAELVPITQEYDSFAEEFNEKVKELAQIASDKADDFEKKFEELKQEVKLLGQNQNESLVYRPTYMLGLKDECMPEYVDTGLQNIVIKPCKDQEKQKAFIQAMIINAFCAVKPLSVTVTVVDPNNRGKDVIGFRSEDMDSNFKIEQRKMTEIISTFDYTARKNLEMLRGIDIQTYNQEAEETGKTPIDYNIILVLSGAEKKEDNEELSAFMTYSASVGIFVWVITPISYKNCYIFNEPFDGVEHPYKFDTLRFPIEFGNEMGDRLKHSKPKGLGWGDYLSRTFKDPDDFWALSGNGYIWIEPGFVEGDPSRADHYTVGNTGDVHGVIAGTSGAGKSVYINHIIATMTKRYGPWDLELWLVDFKGSEFSFYLNTPKTPKTLPHIKACLCTSDPEYSKSLFTALWNMADQRYQTLKSMQLKNMVQYNEMMENEGTPEKRWPRVVMIVDEFQVIFTKADGKTIDSVNQNIILISKVARACGVHLIFASQSMKGTISGDTLAMFTLRMCLRCEVEVSQQILGTPYAGLIRQKNGYLYVASVDDKKKELQKRFKTPWAPDEMLRDHINHCYDEAISRGWKYGNVIEYNEATKHSVEEIDKAYESIKDRTDEEGNHIPNTGIVFLGRLMVYSDNRAPENFIFSANNSENMFACFMDLQDYVNFFFSLKKNFDNLDTKPVVVYNSQSEDYHYLCKLDEIVPEKLQRMSSNKTSVVEMVDNITKLVDDRKKKNIKEIPLIFMCLGWAGAVGFGIDPNQRMMEKFNVLLQTCGEYNVHFIFLDVAKGGVGNSVLKACKYRVCGKVDEMTAQGLCDTGIPAKPTELQNGYAWIYQRNVLSKFKIYQSKLDRKVKEVKVIL